MEGFDQKLFLKKNVKIIGWVVGLGVLYWLWLNANDFSRKCVGSISLLLSQLHKFEGCKITCFSLSFC